MKIESGYFTKEKADSLSEFLDNSDFLSNFKFFQDHNGLRRGELHTLVSPKGSGKSTFIRSITTELVSRKRRTLILLSEEMVDLYKLTIWNTFFELFEGDEKMTNEKMESLFFISELNIENKNKDYFLTRLNEIIVEYDIEVFIYDNFTTGLFSQLPVGVQGEALNEFKKLATDLNIVSFLVFHTVKGVNIYQKVLDGDDVRGNASSVNMGSYNYLLSTFFRESPPRAFLTVDKSRYHGKANKQVYELLYDTTLKLFTKDARSSYQEIQNIIIRSKKMGQAGGKGSASI